MLYEVMNSIHNFFTYESHDGTFRILNGSLALPFLRNGAFFRISGSLLNDGVYQYPAQLMDEEFTGNVSLLAPPKSFLQLVSEIEKYEEQASKAGLYKSESFGDYSYTLLADESGGVLSWQSRFKYRLNAWRKMP